MAEVRAGFPWNGLEYNETLSGRYTRGMGAAIIRATNEAATHPGLYAARYDDAVTPQQGIRPALIVPPSELDKWQALLNAGVGGTNA